MLQAGFGCIDITPEKATHLGGGLNTYRPAHLVGDPLFARAMIVNNQTTKICFISLDLVTLTREYSDKIRNAVAETYCIPYDAVMVHTTQTHSAPGLGYFMLDNDFSVPDDSEWLRGGSRDYCDFAIPRIIESVKCANANMKPALIGIGSGIEGRMAHNRRAVMRDGSIGMPWKNWRIPWKGGQGTDIGPTGVCYIEGPIDPEAGVLCITNPALRPVAVMVNYTCHPVHVYPKQIISADWPGAVVSKIKGMYGSDCFGMVLNGACGNINPWPPFDPDYVEDHYHMGSVLGQMAANIIETMAFQSDIQIDYRAKNIQIPLRTIAPIEHAWAKDILEKHPAPHWTNDKHTEVDLDWVYAASIMSVYLQKQREKALDYEIQIFRVGNAVFVGLPGEPFVEGQLKIKLSSPVRNTYVVHNVNQYAGYIPTKEAFNYRLGTGGHEVDTRYWAKLVPEALDMIVNETIVMLKDIFKQNS